MKNEPHDLNRVLNSHITGFHQYALGETPRPGYISENLCNMLQLSHAQLSSDTDDLYARQVHPADRAAYAAFLQTMSAAEQTATAQYRLLRKDGSVLYVSDTMTSYRVQGAMMGDSVLTDITDLKNENQNLRFLNETMPCGFLKYTCEKTPRITYINDRMLEFMGLGDCREDLELYMQNVYLMIPVEDRRRFSIYLNRVYRHGGPIAGEMTVLRRDGSKAYLFGWVTKCRNDQGVEEFQSACIDITERHHIKKERETRRYLKALSEVYDKIFEYDLSAQTVKCLYGQHSQMFRWIENIPMQMEDATERWITATVFEEDRQSLREFFRAFYQKNRTEAPPMICYRALSSDGTLKHYTGLFVKLSATVSLFCCRSAGNSAEADTLRHENASLKNMQELVMRFSDGLAAFEILDDVVTPLYASDNVCQFFGFTREQWLSIMKKRTPIQEFVAHSKAAYEDFAVLLEEGEAEFTYFDLTQGRERRIKAICSQKSPGDGPRYVMFYNLDRDPAQTPRVRIRTFGYFDVFVDGKPIAFRNEKSKELFALLVDRRGGFVSSEEAIGFLWEEEPANTVTLARYRKVALRLKNLLEEYGIGDIIESVNGKRRLVAEKVSCDLYEYLSGQTQLFKGSYLTNYSWGEYTLAQLTGQHLYGPED